MEWTDNFIQDSRGGSAAGYGYFFESGSTYTNALTFRPGLSTGLATGISWDQYFSIIGESTQLGGTNAPAPRTIRTTNNPAITQRYHRQIGRAVQQECRDRSRMPSSA
eukprot:TRINITY_DN14639_c0_g1_i22.p2 TRINITY_DN14639_c0_g1~~TRINITY_DN14639_c0_g1_i22.p2  ORF type:complete len:108 (-),score=17.85 TRINITY_DN14639_c0_g1_i22:11-334(-)